jgi:hypothetical protein
VESNPYCESNEGANGKPNTPPPTDSEFDNEWGEPDDDDTVETDAVSMAELVGAR